VGDGSRVSFWHDLWCGDLALNEPFQSYLALLVQKMLMLVRTWSFQAAPLNVM
jgi:hypothetical protein